MYIHEAVALAVKTGGYMTRPFFAEALHIEPTNLPERCILHAKGKSPLSPVAAGSKGLDVGQVDRYQRRMGGVKYLMENWRFFLWLFIGSLTGQIIVRLLLL